MGEISWCDATLNPGIYGCSHAGEACEHCYAERIAKRLVGNINTKYFFRNTDCDGNSPIVGPKGWTGRVVVDDINEAKERIQKFPRSRTGRKSVFVTSMGDFLHESIPIAWIAECIEAMRQREDIDWLLLTKRGERWPEVAQNIASWPPNVWPGVTIWNQGSADRLIPPLLQVPAWVRWVSAEPLLGPVDLTHMDVERIAGDVGMYVINALTGRNTDMCRPCPDVPRLSWLIVGGENGPGARHMHPEWTRSLRDQCVGAGVKFHFKGWGSSCSEAEKQSQLAPGVSFKTQLSGHLLDGREWRERP